VAISSGEENSIYYLGIPNLGALLFGSFGVLCPRDRSILIRRKLLVFTSTSNMILIDVAPFVFTNRPN
jgi:hypothetical protein